MRGGGETGCDVRGKQAAVCVHVNTQGGDFRGDEAYFALQSLSTWVQVFSLPPLSAPGQQKHDHGPEMTGSPRVAWGNSVRVLFA
jgi:hypothetical protein